MGSDWFTRCIIGKLYFLISRAWIILLTSLVEKVDRVISYFFP